MDTSMVYALDASGGCNHKLKSEGYFDANFVVYTVFIMVAKSRIFHDTIFVINEVVIMTALSFRVLSTVDKVVMMPSLSSTKSASW